MKTLVSIILFCSLCVGAAAQENTPKTDDGKNTRSLGSFLREKGYKNGGSTIKRSAGETEIDKDTQSPVVPKPPPEGEPDQATVTAYRKSLRAYYEYHQLGLQLRQRTFEWQLCSSKVIFGIVIGLVCVGIYFAWVQFQAGRADKTDGTSSQQEITEIAASKDGIKVSSPVLGVIILVISLGFFYLYLAFVYPITEVF